MNDGQKYDDRESHANSPESIDSTATSATPEVSIDTATAEAPPADLADQPPFIIEGTKGQPVDPISVELPFFIGWQVQTAERATRTVGAIHRVFDEFSSSETGHKLEEDTNQMLAYTALRFAFIDLIEKTALQQLGSFTKPKVREYIYDLPYLATGDPELDNAPVLADNPATCTDVAKLQEWVSTLQQMSRLQVKIAANHETIIAKQDNVSQNQDKLIAALQQQVNNAEAFFKQQTQTEQEQDIPHALPYIDLTLYLQEGLESEVELVRAALAEAGESKLKEVFGHIVLDETDEAFYANEEYRRIQQVSARLSQAVTEAADNSFVRHEFGKRPEFYLHQVKSDYDKLMTRRDAFIDEYSVFNVSEPAEAGAAPEQATTEPQSDPIE